MMTRRKFGGSYYPILDFKKVELRRFELGMSVTALKEAAGISSDIWRKITREKEIRMDSAMRVVNALMVNNLLMLLHPSKLAEFSSLLGENSEVVGLPDWEKGVLVNVTKTPNGLQYIVWKLKQRHESDRWARGKEYRLGPLPTEEQRRMRHLLVRHSEVCNRVRGQPYFPAHITSVPDPGGEAWWVLDEWTPGPTLEDVLRRGAIDSELLPIVMYQIAEGLKTLHEAGVIRRELSPQYIIIEEPGGSVVLTDFELGKLLNADPTVAREWPENRYQANEVPGKTLTEEDKHVDLYSWARILLHAATGNLPDKGYEADAIDAAPLLPRIKKIVKQCLALEGRDRPQSTDEVLQALKDWK